MIGTILGALILSSLLSYPENEKPKQEAIEVDACLFKDEWKHIDNGKRIR